MHRFDLVQERTFEMMRASVGSVSEDIRMFTPNTEVEIASILRLCPGLQMSQSEQTVAPAL